MHFLEGLLLILANALRANGDIPNCDFRDTVDLTGYTAFANGSYAYEGVIIPPSLIGTYDYVLLGNGEERTPHKLHTRGCVCKIKACLQFCCPPNALKVAGELSCSTAIEEALEYEDKVNVTNENGEIREMSVFEDFVLQQHAPCAKPIPLIHEYELWKLYENGSLYSDWDTKTFTKHDYCIHPEDFGDENATYYALAPLLCIAEPPTGLSLQSKITTAVMGISIACFIITFAVYCYVPKFRNLHGKCLNCHLLSLTIGFSILIFNNLKSTVPDNVCIALGIACYFFLISAFLWLSVISFDVWNTFCSETMQRMSQKRKLFIYSMYAWGITILLTAISAYVEFAYAGSEYAPNFRDKCLVDVERWSAMIYMYGPIAVIILFNIFMFSQTAHKIYARRKEMQSMVQNANRETSRMGKEKDTDNFMLFLRLFLVMGITWIFEVVSYLVGLDSEWSSLFFVTDLINAGKGIIIFFMFVWKKKVYQLIKERKSGKTSEDTECSVDEISLQQFYMMGMPQVAERKIVLETEVMQQPNLNGPINDGNFDPYVCSLSAELKAVAKSELHEDDNIRRQALTQFREWIGKHPHIRKCRTDAIFLLRFLRTKKFSVPAACEMLERYLTIRQLFPQWFQKLDIEDPAINEIFENGYLVPLPERDELGRQVIFSVAAKFDPYKFTSVQMARIHSLICEALLDDEDSQVAGYVYINDESGMNMGFVSLWSLTDLRSIMKCIQNSTPMRHKESHFLNIPHYANRVIELCISMLSDKLKKRIIVHKSIDSLKTKIDPAILPKEYGGKVPIDDMIKAFKAKLQQRRAAILALDDMQIEVTKEAANFAGNDVGDIDAGVVGSFRKLEVD